jgi:succinyl-diaminopimelate desuccinylase
MTDKTLELTQRLIACPSTTPNDAGCQEIMIERLRPLGFQFERLRFGDVDNLWAWRGNAKPLVVFAGHTDVVPTGPKEKWKSDPFQPHIRDGFLYGRGASDMKASLAAFVTATEDYLKSHSTPNGSIGFLVTSDEEGPSVNGTVKVVEWLTARGIKMDYCVVGEPSSVKELGDTIKIGRRGSLSGKLTVHGKQGHVAYPHLAINPVHAVAPALAELVAIEWDQGNQHFPKTTFQISNVHGGTGAENVIPGTVEIQFNFRFSTAVTESILKERVTAVLNKHSVKCDIAWRLSGHPFLTQGTKLIAATQKAIRGVTGLNTELSTSGGTSDGRFIAPTGCEVVELGPLNATIHQIDECVSVADLPKLSLAYQRILQELLG